ncbi:ribosomal subunit interface protein [candidate division BRC1 bacterium HGW-BRC1-1]|jgi:ribosome-associated translation inhibitor RaiA|nr:MAG: ribosomal subunit interface protein [candidate division BRC1 bacterium HGW-BRC1-1]
MQIQITTDNNIDGTEALFVEIRGVVENALGRLSDRITRVVVHLSDENSNKKGGQDDMRCVMEARLEGLQPIAVTQQAATVDEAVDGAAGKLTRKIESTIGRLSDKGRQPAEPIDPDEAEDEEES